MRVSPHHGGLSRQSTQPATEYGTTVRPPQRDDIPSPALHSEDANIADIERDRGDWPGEIIEEVGSMVRNCEQLRLSSSTHVFVATAIVREWSLTHFAMGNERQVVRSVVFTYGTAAAVGDLRRTMSSRATARPILKKLGNKPMGGWKIISWCKVSFLKLRSI